MFGSYFFRAIRGVFLTRIRIYAGNVRQEVVISWLRISRTRGRRQIFEWFRVSGWFSVCSFFKIRDCSFCYFVGPVWLVVCLLSLSHCIGWAGCEEWEFPPCYSYRAPKDGGRCSTYRTQQPMSRNTTLRRSKRDTFCPKTISYQFAKALSTNNNATGQFRFSS